MAQTGSHEVSDQDTEISGDDELFMTPEPGPDVPDPGGLEAAVAVDAGKRSDSRRRYKGSYNYVQFFNREVGEFFSKSEETFGEFGEKRVSLVYVHLKVNAAGDIVYDEVPFRRKYREFDGSIWTPEQKAVLFKSLARNSIHRISAIREDLGFTKTAAEIRAYYRALKKDLQHLKRKHNKVQVEINGTSSKYRYRRGNVNLLAYDEMPIAYEMSQNFLVVDESQAMYMNTKEKIQQNDDKRHFLPSMVQMIESGEHLFDLDRLASLTQFYYDHELLEERSRVNLKLHYKSYVLLEELVRSLLTKIILNLSGFEVVTTHSLIQVIHKLQLLDPSKLQYIRDDYLYKLVGRECHKRRLKFHQIMHEPNFVEPFLLEPQAEQESAAVIDIAMLPRMAQQNDDNIEEIIETRALNKELQTLNRSDMSKSTNYEHIVLTWLATANPTKDAGATVCKPHQQALEKWGLDAWKRKCLSKVKKYQKKDKYRSLGLWDLNELMNHLLETPPKEAEETYRVAESESSRAATAVVLATELYGGQALLVQLAQLVQSIRKQACKVEVNGHKKHTGQGQQVVFEAVGRLDHAKLIHDVLVQAEKLQGDQSVDEGLDDPRLGRKKRVAQVDEDERVGDQQGYEVVVEGDEEARKRVSLDHQLVDVDEIEQDRDHHLDDANQVEEVVEHVHPQKLAEHIHHHVHKLGHGKCHLERDPKDPEAKTDHKQQVDGIGAGVKHVGYLRQLWHRVCAPMEPLEPVNIYSKHKQSSTVDIWVVDNAHEGVERAQGDSGASSGHFRAHRRLLRYRGPNWFH